MIKNDKILNEIKSKLEEQQHKISHLPDANDMYELGIFKGMREIYRLIKDLRDKGNEME